MFRFYKLSTALIISIIFITCSKPERAEIIITQIKINKDQSLSGFYQTHSLFTEPGKYSYLYKELPDDISILIKDIQGLLIHEAQAHLYGVQFSKIRENEMGIRTVENMLDRILQLDNRPLTIPRSPKNRLIGNCRHFSVLLCSFLRSKNLPARARAGYENYSKSSFHGDHWICEYWNKSEGRWIQVDAQLDDVQIRAFNINFDPNDLPEGKYLSAGFVYKNCRNGNLDPDSFGVFEDFKGFWHVKENLIRDFLALNKIEILPWDHTTIMNDKKNPFEQTKVLYDSIGKLTTETIINLPELHSIFNNNSSLHVSLD